MAQFEHLPLRKVGEPAARRKRSAFIKPPDRDRPRHARKLSEETDEIIRNFRESLPPDAVEPSLILKVKLGSSISDDTWPSSGLEVLAHTDDDAVILFSSDSEMTAFRERVAAYQGGPRIGENNPPYSGFFDAIEALVPLEPRDRIGPALRAYGLTDIEHFSGDETMRLDLELWRPEVEDIDRKLNAVVSDIEQAGGEIHGEYRAPTGLLLRVVATKEVFGKLLLRKEIAEIDQPPVPDLEVGGLPQIGLDEVSEFEPPNSEAICIGIIDSGINDGHPLLQGVVAGAFGLGGLDTNDEKGHGTAVAALAAYGDIGQSLQRRDFKPRFRIASARVVDANGNFPDMELAPKLVDEAIRRLHSEFGCRIINMSLADPKRMVGIRASLWAEAIDNLARELDILIIVAAGNSDAAALTAAHGPNIVTAYPNYLIEPPNKILDPAGAINVLTVGALAHVNGLSLDDDERVELRPIASAFEPAPFTRAGHGLGGAIKPDLVEFGGTAVYNGLTQRTENGKDRPAAGILTLSHKPTERLFSTFSGTSFAAPIVAWKAAVLLERFPDATANFLRSVLALSATSSETTLQPLKEMKDTSISRVLGNGHVDIEHAVFSDDDRVVLFTNDEIELNKFIIYEVPIPERYQRTEGIRTIDLSLAFDPPVRRTRRDYQGVKMQFDLIRGMKLEDVFDAYRALDPKEDEPDKIPDRYKCKKLYPGINARSRGTLQRCGFKMKTNISGYGDTYYLVMRCLGRWATGLIERQPFTLSAMLTHEAQVSLYTQLRARLRT